MDSNNDVIEYLKELSNKVQDNFAKAMDKATLDNMSDKEIDGIENHYALDLFAIAKTIFLINSLNK